jgi:hypothetical protein
VTTTVIVKANHGWPVRVTPILPDDGQPIGPETIVPPDAERDFYVHNCQDLLIHEVQPGEGAPTPGE